MEPQFLPASAQVQLSGSERDAAHDELTVPCRPWRGNVSVRTPARWRVNMRFMVMHKVDAKMEAGGPPDQEIIQGMGALIGEGFKAGTVLDGAGLHRSAARARLTKKAGGKRSVERGPYAGGNELVASVAMLKAMSMDEAIGHAERFADALGDGQVEIGPVVEAWDLGLMPKPSTPGGRFLLLCKGDAETEAGSAPNPEQRAALARLEEELRAAGVLLKSETLAPSSQGSRLPSAPKDKRAWVDGPFAEAKELIAGFTILKMPSLAEARAWAERYAAILGDNEIDVRLLEG
jgi:hypothetical protein